jgi:hypothetical protein
MKGAMDPLRFTSSAHAAPFRAGASAATRAAMSSAEGGGGKGGEGGIPSTGAALRTKNVEEGENLVWRDSRQSPRGGLRRACLRRQQHRT